MKTTYSLLLLSAALTLGACGSTKPIVKDGAVNAPAATDAAMAYKRQVVDTRQTAATLTARLGVNISAGGKSISCNGHLRMKRDDVLQLSLTLPLLGTEVGRLECTPTEVLIVDRINRQYVRAKYADVGFLSQAGLDFYTLQALFWNELFVPGSRSIDGQLQRFRLSQSGSHTLLALTDAPRLEYDFLTVTETAKINRVSVRGKNVSDKGELVCTYSDFKTVGGKPFPAVVKLDVKDLGKDLSLKLELSRVNNSADWETRTSVSSRYAKRSAEDIMRQIMKLAN